MKSVTVLSIGPVILCFSLSIINNVGAAIFLTFAYNEKYRKFIYKYYVTVFSELDAGH